MATTNFYKSSFGGLRLWLSNIRTERSRDHVVHDLSAGDAHVVQDRGRSALRVTCSVLFDWMDGDDLAPIDRLRKLQALVDDQPRLFTHPTDGTFLARVGPFSDEIDASGVITAQLEFIAVEDVKPVMPVGAGGIPASGSGAVSAAADAMTAELADVGMTSTTPAEAAAAADAWATSGDINPRDVIAQTGSLTSDLGDQAATMEDDIALWSAFKSTVLLAETVRIAAQSATAGTSQTFTLRVGAGVALRGLLAGIYPADEAAERYDEVMLLNDIATPAWLDEGSLLELPLPTPGARVG